MQSAARKYLNQQVRVFNEDILSHQSYFYTLGNTFSSLLAAQRTTGFILAHQPFRGKKVIDIGCGDGFFTGKFWSKGKPSLLVGVDYSTEAIKLAKRKNSRGGLIKYLIGDAYKLPFKKKSFDLALLQSVLHHDADPEEMIKEAFRVAPAILIHEPNGNNPGLKVIEKVSDYHLKHQEKSYSTSTLVNFIEKAGGRVERIEFAGFVPMFCPDWLAKIMKSWEPLVEKTPWARKYFCAVTLISASKNEKGN